MYRPTMINGILRKYGVLNDFDLAIFTTRDKNAPRNKHRTGTPPFMACELLEEDSDVHWPRFDIESFFNLHYWVVVGFDQGIELPDHPLVAWTTSSFEQLYVQKKAFWASQILPSKHTQTFSALQPVTYKLFGLIKNGLESWETFKGRYHFDWVPMDDMERYNIKTLDDNVTHNKYIEVLSEGLKELEEKGEVEGLVVSEPHAVQYRKSGLEYDAQDWDPDNDQIVRKAIQKLRDAPEGKIDNATNSRIRELKSKGGRSGVTFE